MSASNARYGRKPEPNNLNLIRLNVEKFVEHETFSQLSAMFRPLVDGWNEFCRACWIQIVSISPDDPTKMLLNLVRVLVEIVN